jgi:TrmH family RNA methyltransferase
MPYDYFFNGLKKQFDLIIGTTSVMGTDYNIPRTPITSKELSKEIDKLQKIAIIFGNEGNGLSNEEISNCDFVATIPTSKKYHALNISHAAAIFFYELFVSTGTESIVSHIAPAYRKEREVIFSKIDFIVENLPFSTKEKKDTQKITWKRVIEKSLLSKREAFAVMGLLRKIEKKLSKS